MSRHPRTNHMVHAMNFAASDTWDLMETGIAGGIGPGEETLTDLNLIRLQTHIPSLRVTKFDKAVEAGNGADWEWWIGSSAEERWIKLRIQAKRASHDADMYEQLGHTVKGVKQYDNLIFKSLTEDAIPLYVFFNGWPEDRFLVGGHYHDAIAQNLRAVHGGHVPYPLWGSLDWGCAIAAAQKVKAIHGDPSVSDFPAALIPRRRRKNKRYIPRYLVHSTPWAYLLHSGSGGATPTIRQVAENLHHMEGNRSPLTDDAFEEMTHPLPSRAAEQAAYNGGFSIRKSLTTVDEARHAERLVTAREFAREIGRDDLVGRMLNLTDETERTGPGYRLLLELNPESSFFMSQG
ncbi:MULTISPECIES: DUF6615 family protein [unclassified Rhodococcus (in: high G+C Gram-positive bacteria)]|nr:MULTISPECIES: DUF6615 family protein [unclassified Rhodococcus (in: high G+C Gram-positive bacteria)]